MASINEMEREDFIIDHADRVLVTGASGFIGYKLVELLLERGFKNVRCFVRPSSELKEIEALRNRFRAARVELVSGNLLSRADCDSALDSVAVVFHLATGRDGKSYPDAFMNAVVTTRNLLEASLRHKCLRRFVNVSSFAVYQNKHHSRHRLLDEASPVENHPELRGDAYSFAKIKQDELVQEYGKKFGIPYVIVRPGYVLGPGKESIPSRVGIDTFGVFLHLGGANPIPLTYVDNCAEAIALAGLKQGIDAEVFNVVDDDLPSSRRFLRLYKQNVRRFNSFYVPHVVSYALCYLWERYSKLSEGQLPPTFNRLHWHAYWKKTYYRNEKLKRRIGWTPRVSMADACNRFFQGCRGGVADA